ncbi:MAG: hypothetical protein ABGY09_05575 [Euryarchaeota archaeon]
MRGQVSIEFALLSIAVVGLVGVVAAGYLGPEYEWFCVRKAAEDAVEKTCDEVAAGIEYRGTEISGELRVRDVKVGQDRVEFRLEYEGINKGAVLELLRRNVLFHVYVAVRGRPRSVEEVGNPVRGWWGTYRVSVGGSDGRLTVVVERVGR